LDPDTLQGSHLIGLAVSVRRERERERESERRGGSQVDKRRLISGDMREE
jgi:hypothetical protein